jgi:hypothetical protein
MADGGNNIAKNVDTAYGVHCNCYRHIISRPRDFCASWLGKRSHTTQVDKLRRCSNRSDFKVTTA